MNRKRTDDYYHRIYRLGQRKIDPKIVAATLRLPLRTVQRILDHLFYASSGTGDKGVPITEIVEKGKAVKTNDALKLYVFSRVRYAVVDCSGCITDPNIKTLDDKMQELISTDHKAIALRLREVNQIDEKGVEKLLDINATWIDKGRYMAILDPAPMLESTISAYGLDKKIPIFGTERVFEDIVYKKSQ